MRPPLRHVAFGMPATLALLLALTGCAAKSGSTTPPPPHPGAANAFDSAAYDSLVTIQAGIEQAKVNAPVGQKALLNQIIADYNLAMHAYEAYHAAATAGTAAPTAQADLQAKIDALKTNLASVGGK